MELDRWAKGPLAKAWGRAAAGNASAGVAGGGKVDKAVDKAVAEALVVEAGKQGCCRNRPRLRACRPKTNPVEA
jgi:hypothetical protein